MIRERWPLRWSIPAWVVLSVFGWALAAFAVAAAAIAVVDWLV